jgi:hypothetical protein
MEPEQTSGAAGLQAARERRISLRAAMSALERAMAAPAYGRSSEWIAGVREAVGDLHECMRAHVDATEGPAGFHREILTAAPRLSHSVEISVREHVLIGKLLDQLVTVLDSPGGLVQPDELVEALRDTGTRLLGLLVRHRQRGADMIFEAYEAELGGEN